MGRCAGGGGVSEDVVRWRDTDHGFVGGGDSCCRDGDGEAGTGTRYPASGVGGDKGGWGDGFDVVAVGVDSVEVLVGEGGGS